MVNIFPRLPFAIPWRSPITEFVNLELLPPDRVAQFESSLQPNNGSFRVECTSG